MASLSLLATDLQALSKEAGRKYSDVRDSSEKAYQCVRKSPEKVLYDIHTSETEGEMLYEPFFLSAATNNARLNTLAVSIVQRLVGAGAMPKALVPRIVETLDQVASQGADVQLKVLQALLVLCAGYVGGRRRVQHTRVRLVEGELLTHVLNVANKLQRSKTSMVASTASATLRQMVMSLFERVEEEDRDGKKTAHGSAFVVDVPVSPEENNGKRVMAISLADAARDAYCTFEDLCTYISAATGDKSQTSAMFLQLDSVPATFGLELVESIVNGFSKLIRAHKEMILVLRAHLCPLLTRILNSKPSDMTFPLSLRLVRVTYIILRLFPDLLPVESEVFLSLLTRIINSGSQDPQYPPFMKTLALEVVKAIVSDFDHVLFFFSRYDERSKEFEGKNEEKASSHVVGQLLQAVSATVAQSGPNIEKDTILEQGASLEKNEPSVEQGASEEPSAFPQLDTGGLFSKLGELVGASDKGTVEKEHASGADLHEDDSLSTTQARMKMQVIDQLDKQNVPNIPSKYNALVAFHIAASLAQGFASYVLPKFASLVSASKKDHEASFVHTILDVASLHPDWEHVQELSIARNTAIALAPHLNFSIKTFWLAQLDEALFKEATLAVQNFSVVVGVLGLPESHTALLPLLSEHAVPLTVAHGDANYTLSTRSTFALRTLVATCVDLAPVMGEMWSSIFEKLEVSYNCSLDAIRDKVPLSDLCDDLAQNASDTVAQVLKVVSSPFIQDVSESSEADSLPSETLIPSTEEFSGLIRSTDALFSVAESFDTPQLAVFSRALCSKDSSFYLAKLTYVALRNLSRFVHDPVLWRLLTERLLSLHSVKAAVCLDAVLVATPPLWGEDAPGVVQVQLLEALQPQVAKPFSARLAFKTLFIILREHGLQLVNGWDIVFSILSDGAKSGQADLVLLAFESMRLITDELLQPLSAPQILQCIVSLTSFGQQESIVDIALEATRRLWDISANIKTKQNKDKVELWLGALSGFTNLAGSSVPEVRNTAIKMLFSSLAQHDVDTETWQSSFFEQMFPLLATIASSDARDTSDPQVETQILTMGALEQLICETHLSRLVYTAKYRDIWVQLLLHFQRFFLEGSPKTATAAMSSLNRILVKAATDDKNDALKATLVWSWDHLWHTWVSIGRSLDKDRHSLSEDNLVEFVRLIRPLSHVSKLPFDTYEHVEELLSIFDHVLTYGTLEDPPQSKKITPLQHAVLDIIDGINMDIPHVPSLVITHLAQYQSLPFAQSRSTQFLGLSNHVMPHAVDLYKRFATDPLLYVEAGAVYELFASFEKPLALHEYQFTDTALDYTLAYWQTSMNTFLDALNVCVDALPKIAPSVTTIAAADGHRASPVWEVLLRDIRIALHVLLTYPRSYDQLNADLEERMIFSLKHHVTKSLGENTSVPLDIMAHLAATLQNFSCVYKFKSIAQGNGQSTMRINSSFDDLATVPTLHGTTIPIDPVSRPHFAFACLDLLFSLCDVSTYADKSHYPRIASQSLNFLISRCIATLRTYLADARIAGRLPLPKERIFELFFVLSHIYVLDLGPTTNNPLGALQPYVLELLQYLLTARQPPILSVFDMEGLPVNLSLQDLCLGLLSRVA